MVTMYTSYYNSIANIRDKTEVENEDYIKIGLSDNHTANFILCDGAGGVGVFNKEWAKYLAESTPHASTEFEQNSREWFYETAREFHDQVISTKDLSDLILNKKVYRDGSYSTFCAVWLDLEQNNISYSVVGDTYLFIFQNKGEGYEIKEIVAINKQNDFEENPELLNWNIDLQTNLPYESQKLGKEFIILMASDSLARWIILNICLIDPFSLRKGGANQDYLNSLSQEKHMARKETIARNSRFRSMEDLLLFLKEILLDKKIFEAILIDLVNCDEIDVDDYSLIYIRGNVSE